MVSDQLEKASANITEAFLAIVAPIVNAMERLTRIN